MAAQPKKRTDGVEPVAAETDPTSALADDVRPEETRPAVARVTSNGISDAAPDATDPIEKLAFPSSSEEKLRLESLDDAALHGLPADEEDEQYEEPAVVPQAEEVHTTTREINDIAELRDLVQHGDRVVDRLAGGSAPDAAPGKPNSPDASSTAAAGGESRAEQPSGEKTPVAGDSSSDGTSSTESQPAADEAGGSAPNGQVDAGAILDGTDGAAPRASGDVKHDSPDASQPSSTTSSETSVAARRVPDAGERAATGDGAPSATPSVPKSPGKPPVKPSGERAADAAPDAAERPAGSGQSRSQPAAGSDGSGGGDSGSPSRSGNRPADPAPSEAQPSAAVQPQRARRRLFADREPPRIGRSIPRMLRSTLTQMAGMPLGFELDTDEADEPFLPTELPSLSLQHVLGLARVDQDIDPDLEADLKAELGVHGINVEEFQERLNAMLSSRHREHVMYEVQASFRSVLDSVEQLSRLTTGQVRYRNERLSADAQQVVRVLLAVRVAAERVDEAVRLSEQGIRQTHDYGVSLSRLIRDCEVRVKLIHTTAANVEGVWHQLQAHQAAAAPERALVVWCGAAAAVGAGVVSVLLSLLGY